ncbi:PA14 domain-containing protein [Paenibacillus larvae]|nr:PA14 domain-containing protein [Paenibacillus larvae]MDT2238990.1 PA14 domain-containing protein [Paenibacillus larvae]
MNGFKLDNKTLDDMNVRKNIKSVRWLANFKPRKSGAYTFTINPNCFAHILIDGENAKDQEMQLEAGKSYPFMVAYFEIQWQNKKNCFN